MTGFLRYWRRWAALALVLALVVASIRPLQKRMAIRWVEKNGGGVSTEPGWLSRQIPVKTQNWLNQKFQSWDWTDPFDIITGLTLANLSSPSDRPLHRLVRMPHLEYLSVHDCEFVDDDDLKIFRGCRNLSYVSLEDTKVTDAGLEHLQRTSKISELYLCNTGIHGEGLVHLLGNQGMRNLGLRKTEVTNEVAVMIASQFQKLEYLDLSHTVLTDEGLADMEALPDLDTFMAERSKITDAGLVHLKKFPKLEVLTIGGAEISDAGMMHLRKFPTLKVLTISGPGLSDAGLEILAKQANLTEIYLKADSITDAGIEKFYEMSGNCALVDWRGSKF